MKRFALTMGCVAMMVAYLIFEDGSERETYHEKSLKAQAPIYLSDTNFSRLNPSVPEKNTDFNTLSNGRK